MTTTPKTTAERLKKIRERNGQSIDELQDNLCLPPSRDDVAWLCDKLQGALDELETVCKGLVEIQGVLRALKAELGIADHIVDLNKKVTDG